MAVALLGGMPIVLSSCKVNSFFVSDKISMSFFVDFFIFRIFAFEKPYMWI